MPPSASSRNSAPRTGRKRCTSDGCRKLAPAGRKRCDEHKPGRRAPKAPPKLFGKTEPRLFTPPLRPLTRETSLGYKIIDFARMIGEVLFPWQEWALIHAFELNPDKSLRFRTILILVSRQNGKSKLARIITLWRLYVDGAELILGAAQDVSQAREQQTYTLEMAKADPELSSELGKASGRNGDEWFGVTGGGRYKITAANDKAGRGLSVDLLFIDELRTHTDWKAWGALESTTRAKARGQVLAMSNMGGPEAVVLNQLRDRALAEADPRLGIFEWSAPDGCELDDREAWAQANPSLGYLFGEDSLQSARNGPAWLFRTENLCQKVDQTDAAIDIAAWRDCADAGGSMAAHRHRLIACFEVAMDGKHATLALAAKLPDGRIRIEIAASWDSTEAARAELPRLLSEGKPIALAWYPSGPAAALAPVLRARRGSVELTGGKVGEACQGLADLTIARQVIHSGDPLLDKHVAMAQKLHSGDSWRFDRPDEGHIDAAYAAAGAAYVAAGTASKAPRIRMLG